MKRPTKSEVAFKLKQAVQKGLLAAIYSKEDKPSYIESRKIRVLCNHCNKLVNWQYSLDYDKKEGDGA